MPVPLQFTSFHWSQGVFIQPNGVSSSGFHFFIGYVISVQDTEKFAERTLDMTKLYSLIPVWMTLLFTQGHRIMGKARTCAVIVKLHEETQIFMMVDRVKEMTVKKSCKYGNMDHLSSCSSCIWFPCWLGFLCMCLLFHNILQYTFIMKYSQNEANIGWLSI